MCPKSALKSMLQTNGYSNIAGIGTARSTELKSMFPLHRPEAAESTIGSIINKVRDALI